MNDASLIRDHLVADLQDTSLRMSMQPYPRLRPLRRTVRDLAREYGKDIAFIVNGGETNWSENHRQDRAILFLHLIVIPWIMDWRPPKKGWRRKSH